MLLTGDGVHAAGPPGPARLTEERIGALRRLWNGEQVRIDGRWARITPASISPPAAPDLRSVNGPLYDVTETIPRAVGIQADGSMAVAGNG